MPVLGDCVLGGGFNLIGVGISQNCGCLGSIVSALTVW